MKKETVISHRIHSKSDEEYSHSYAPLPKTRHYLEGKGAFGAWSSGSTCFIKR